MRKFFHQIHLWLSVPFGLIITIVCLSGAALVFEKEVMEYRRPDLYKVKEIRETKMPVDQLLTIVGRTLPDSVSVTGVTIAADPRKTYQVNLSYPHHAAVFVDPYTGEVKGAKDRGAFFTFMLKMHRRLLGSMQPGPAFITGKQVVGISTLIFIVVLLTGLFLWLPRTQKILKNKWKITVDKGWRRFWYDLHVVGGMYATLLLLAMALTGLTWSFPWYRTAFYRLFGAEATLTRPAKEKEASLSAGKGKRPAGKAEGKKERNRDEKKEQTFTHWQKVYDQLCVSNPAYKQITLSDGSATVAFEGWGNQRASDRYLFNPHNGEMTETVLYDAQEVSVKLRGWIYSVHVGNWGGIASRILYCLAALLGGILPLTGYYLWIKKWKRKNGR